MLTFQILDGGESYYRTLEDRRLTIGRQAGVDIQLDEEGVAGEHAEVEPEGDSYRIRAIAAGAPLLVNGVAQQAASLVVGDRIEIGRAVLVLGRQLKRPATAADLLQTTPTRDPRDPWPEKRSKAVRRMFVVVGLIAAVVFWLVADWSAGVVNSRIPNVENEALVRARRSGRFDEARNIADALAAGWAKGHPDRLELVEGQRRHIASLETDFHELRDRYLARRDEETPAQQIAALNRLRAGDDARRAEAADILVSHLIDYRYEADAERAARLAAAGPDPDADSGRGAKPPPPRPAWIEEHFARGQELRQAGEFRQAVALLTAALAKVPPAHVQQAEPLRELLADVRNDAREEMRRLVDRAHELRKAGELATGVELLRAAADRFPARGALSLLHRELGYLAAEQGVEIPDQLPLAIPDVGSPSGTVLPPDTSPGRRASRDGPLTPGPVVGPGPVPGPGPAPGPATDPEEAGANRGSRRGLDTSLIARTLGEVREAKATGDLERAGQLLEEARKANELYQPKLAAYLADEIAKVASVRVFASALVERKDRLIDSNVPLDGLRFRVTGVDPCHLRLRDIGGATRELTWLELPLPVAAALAATADLSPDARLGVVSLGYLRHEPAAAEAYLAALLPSDARLLELVGPIVSRGRGESLDPEGYALVDGAFVARRFLKVEKLAKDFGRKLAALGTASAAERRAALEVMRASPEPGAEDALVLALRQVMDDYAVRLQRNPLRKQIDRLADRRVALDAARQHAASLIFDTKEYFYPYRPPEVSAEKSAAYNKVQMEVDARVAAVEKVWLDKTKVLVGERVRQDIDLVLWCVDELDQMGELSTGVLEDIDWIRSIPPVAALTIRSYCKTAEECRDLVHYLKIEELNEALAERLNVAETAQVEITNSYRMMFGRRPLAVDLRLHEATRGHAEDMSTKGYLSHTSSTPGRKTPHERMTAAGYSAGASENIALNPSALGAHNGWLHSSGHHRNILDPAHTEFAVGNSGKYWVQNFGRGTDYTEQEAFPR